METPKCTYCQNVIDTCRIKCAECPEFDLCLQCFACGAESGPHKKEHDYHVLDGGHFELFETEEGWEAREEQVLLETIEHYGFGNWEDVGLNVATKTSDQCREHYYAYYIHGNIGKATFPTEFKTHIVTDHSCPDGGPLSPTLTTPLPPLELTLQEQQELGYMPLRDDFEREYDNGSESLVSGLSINYDDEDLDIDFKIAEVDMYRYRLKERDRRKRLAREYGLLQQATTLGMKKAQMNKKKLPRDEKELQDKMRVFSQFHSAKEHEAFFTNLQKEKHLKSRIKELMRYRRNGIKKLDEIPDYEAEKSRRDKRREYKKKLAKQMLEARKRALKLYAAQQRAAAMSEPVNGGPVNGELPQPAVNGELVEPLNGTIPHHHPNGKLSNGKTDFNGHQKRKRRRKYRRYYRYSETCLERPHVRAVALDRWSLFKGDRHSGGSAKDMLGLPSGDLLSDREKKLCTSMGMKPASYMTIKTCIIRDYLQRRQGINVKIRYPNHLDKTYRRRILNFLNENGWLGGVGSA